MQQQRDALNVAAAQSQSAVQSQADTFGRSLFAGQVNDSSISDTQFVTNLYEAFLQRGPDAGGLGWWSGQATVGTGRQNVLGAFAGCPAFRDLSGTLYREANWLVSDHLGTPRMIANKSGSLASMKRHDYLPFGEELAANIGGRTTTQGYAGDSVRQKFTRKERDNETGLDYFLARYYSSNQGRFTSPDEFSGGPDELYTFAEDASDNPTFYGDMGQPQSLNKYQYAYNNPLRFTDPYGHCPQCIEEVVEEVAESPAGQQVINAGGAAITSVIIAASGAVPKLAEAGGHLLEKIGGQETVACNECNQWTYQSKWSKAEGGAKGAQATDEKTKGSGDAVKKGQEDTRQKPQDQPNRKAAKEAFNREAGSNSRKPIRDRNTGKLKGVGAGKASYRPKGRDRYSVTPKSGKAKDTLHFP